MNTIQNKSFIAGAALIALMAATRMHHFGSSLHMPDASLAVFLLAGFLISSPTLLGALFVEAATLDYVAITHLGVDDYCVTPAYWFLIPTYGVLWLAGRHYARIHQHSLRSLGMFAGTAFAAVSTAFVISNGSFYLFSGRYPNMNVAEYIARIAQYYPQYLTGGLLYLFCAAGLYAALSSRAPATAKAAAE